MLAPKDIRASAQGLIVFATNGLGMLLGSLLAGQVAKFFLLEPLKIVEASGVTKNIEQHNWAGVFMVPIAITILAGIAFLSLFSERRFQADAQRVEAESAAAIQS